MADIDGDAHVDLLSKSSSRFSALLGAGDRPWAEADRGEFTSQPPVDLDDPSLKLVDVNNDRRSDIVLVGSDELRVWLAHGASDWSTTADVVRDLPLGGGQIDFGQPNVQLADMTGDGLLGIPISWLVPASWFSGLVVAGAVMSIVLQVVWISGWAVVPLLVAVAVLWAVFGAHVTFESLRG